MSQFDKELPVWVDTSYGTSSRRWKSRERLHFYIVWLALFIVSYISWLVSLQGFETPEELAAAVPSLVSGAVSAIVCASAEIWFLILYGKGPYWFRALAFGTQFLRLVAWHLVDNGSTTQHHGAYNILIYVLIMIPLNLGIAIIYLWYQATKRPNSSRRFWQQFGTCLVLGLVLLVSASHYYTDLLDYGFLDKKIPCSGSDADAPECDSCQWHQATPWFDLVPFRLNFWTGPMSCPVDHTFSAYFEQGSLVIEGCDSKYTELVSFFNDSVIRTFDGPAYSILPRTETWTLQQKADSLSNLYNPLQHRILNSLEEETYAWKRPVKVRPEVDAVVAWCGASEPKLVHRIVSSKSEPSKAKLGGVQDSSEGEGLNVVTIFLDAVSRAQFHRRLPQTKAVIEALTLARNSTSSVYEFFRYHTVGLNTGPNTRALWAGLADKNVDGVPLWEQYETAGYISGRLDPMCQDWSAYYNPVHLPNSSVIKPRISHEYLSFSCLPPYLPTQKFQDGNFAGTTSIKARCISSTHVSHYSLDWATSFINHYRENDPRSFYLHVGFMEGHEGTGAVLQTVDSRLADFLDPRLGPIDYNKTAVILVADHGALMGLNFAFSKNGKIEAANPMAAMILPDWYVEQRQQSRRSNNVRTGADLREAEGRLVTAFDIYETTRGFMTGGGSSEPVRDIEIPGRVRGIDLLSEGLPDRSCEEAGITNTKCMCT